MFRDHRALAYGLMRLAIGVNITGHGFFRILSGVGAFANGMAAGLDKSPLPHALNLGFGYCIPWIELTLGVMLMLGLFTRAVLVGGAVLMIVLTFGTVSNQNWGGASTQLVYSLAFFALLWTVEANRYSADTLLLKKD